MGEMLPWVLFYVANMGSAIIGFILGCKGDVAVTHEDDRGRECKPEIETK